MQLQFDKTALPIMKMIKREIKNVEQTQELRINDGMPDIGKVLGAWGQVILRSKEWQQGNGGVNGGVQVSVLYVPENGEDVQTVETWIPFQTKWELPESDHEGTICVSCLLRSADARNTSSRKILVRVNVGVCGLLWEPSEVWQHTPPELPEDICLLKKTHSVKILREAGEKAFSLEEELVLPGTAPKIEKLFHYHLQLELIEQKIMSDKVVFRGVGLLHILYRGDDGQLHTWDFELPFSQYGELSGEYEQGALAKMIMAVTSLEAELDMEGRVQMKAGLVGQYFICQDVPIEVVEDVYSPRRQAMPIMERICLHTIQNIEQQTVQAEQTIQSQGVSVDVAFYPDHPHSQQIGDNTVLQIPGQFQVLFKDDEGQYRSAASRWEGQCPATEEDALQIIAYVNVTGKTKCATDGAGMSMTAELLTDLMIYSQQEIPMVVGIEMTELAEPDPERPSLILRRAGEDSLWNIAKASGSTVEMIMEANHLEGKLDPEQMLLIPVL